MNSRTLNFLLIFIGGVIALYADTGDRQNTYILIAGIFLLMIGLYRLSRGIPSKNAKKDDNFIVEDEQE